MSNFWREELPPGFPLSGRTLHRVELYWDRPPDRCPRTPFGEIAMRTGPLDFSELA